MHERVHEEQTLTRATSAASSNNNTSLDAASPAASRASSSKSLASSGSMGSQVLQAFEDYPPDTNAQVLSLAFGIGPSAGLLFVGLDDDTVSVVDTKGLAPMLDDPFAPAGTGV